MAFKKVNNNKKVHSFRKCETLYISFIHNKKVAGGQGAGRADDGSRGFGFNGHSHFKPTNCLISVDDRSRGQFEFEFAFEFYFRQQKCLGCKAEGKGPWMQGQLFMGC